MPDSHESTGQDVKKKTANKFCSSKGHDSLTIVFSIISPTKGDRFVVHLDQPVIRNGDAVSVSGQVIEDLLRASEWRLAINHPFLFPTFSQKPTERVGIGKALRLTFQLEFGFSISLFETVKEEFAKSTGKDSNRKKEILSGVDPCLAVLGKSSARNHTMEMRVEEKVLSPSVQNGGKPDLRSQVFGIGGDGEKGSRGCLKEEVIDDTPVLKGKRLKMVWQGENDMKVRDGKKFFLTSLEPFFLGQDLTFWTVPVPTGVVGNLLVSTLATMVHMPTQDRSPADLDCAHHTLLLVGSHPPELLMVGGTKLSNDIRHLMGWPSHLRKGEAIPNDRVQRTVGLPNGRRGNTSIALSRSETLMTKKNLDRPNLCSRF